MAKAALFSKVKGGQPEKKQLGDLLMFVVNGTRGEAGCALVPNTLATKIEKLEPGLIQPRSGAEVDPAGNIAVYATSKGIAAVLGEEAAASTPAAAAPAASAPAAEGNGKSAFTLDSGFVVPPTKRGGIKADIYPFAQMAVNQSFFVPATEDKPNPAKALASTVSSATKRYAAAYPVGHAQAGQATGKDGRKFVVRARTAGVDGEKLNGARVYRIA